jgi:all-trans-retinol 13,14-reductase
MMFISFPSLKDPEHDPGPSNRHTGEALVWADWSSVAGFADREPEERAAEWVAFKQGVETTPRRMLSEALAARTPVPGLFLTGQDVMTPGIAGALAGGMLGAAAIDPRVYRKFVW